MGKGLPSARQTIMTSATLTVIDRARINVETNNFGFVEHSRSLLELLEKWVWKEIGPLNFAVNKSTRY